MYKSVHLQVTGRCNANCKTCYVQQNDEDFDITKLDELPDALEYAIGGGEPLLYPHLKELIQKLKCKGKYVAVTTNGTIKESLDVDKEMTRRSATGSGMDLDTVDYELEERRGLRLDKVSRSLERNL